MLTESPIGCDGWDRSDRWEGSGISDSHLSERPCLTPMPWLPLAQGRHRDTASVSGGYRWSLESISLSSRPRLPRGFLGRLRPDWIERARSGEPLRFQSGFLGRAD